MLLNHIAMLRAGAEGRNTISGDIRSMEHSSSQKNSRLKSLYDLALPSKRTGPLYGAFPYPTKISPESIALFIAAHTRPGETVFDGFAGSGTTGLAALLCENPTDDLKAEAKRLNLDVKWGARNAVLYEIGALGAFVGKTLTSPPNPHSFRKAAQELLGRVETSYAWMYDALDPSGRQGSIRHAVWSDLISCPECGNELSLWDASVTLKPAQIATRFDCPKCHSEVALDDAVRKTETLKDELLGRSVESRSRVVARIYGSTGKSRWSRAVTSDDLELLSRIEAEPMPGCVPHVSIPWGDLYRGGYHKGMTHLHHFYTRRNLIIFAALWEATESYSHSLRDALRFWLLSYNAAHATIMTRVVAKSNQKDLVVTSAQPGVLYVSGLPVEKNLFAGLRRKLKTITDAFAVIHGRKGHVSVNQRSSCDVDLPDGSVDYVFTDPPFGGNIPYAEINFINEAWLNRFTDRQDEAIVSHSQKKNITKYQELLTEALSEAHRILKPGGEATLVFHSASSEVWNALRSAYSCVGFSVQCAGVLDKKQGSFKQVTTTGAVRGDPVLLLQKTGKMMSAEIDCVWTVAENLREAANDLGPCEQSAQRLYSRLVSHYLTRDLDVPLDAEEFYRWHDAQTQVRAVDSADR